MAVSLQVYKAELNVLREIGQIVGQLLDLDYALAEALKAISRSLAVGRAIIALLDPETGKLTMKATYGLRPAEKKKGMCLLAEGNMDRITGSIQPFILPRSGKKLLLPEEIQSASITKEEIAYFGAPIVIQEKTAGILIADTLFSTEIPIEEDIHFLVILAEFIAAFIDLSRQADERERSIENRNRSLLAEISEKYNQFFIVGKSKSMRQLRTMIEEVAPGMTPVMLLGEPGTERALVARIIHELSRNVSGSFIKLNCATLEEGQTDSELFSVLKMAEGGTVFLDEIGSLPIALQGVLLSQFGGRKSEGQGVKRTRRTKTGARIIAATDKDLAEAVSAGSFREDLYYRLNAFPLHIPPLRERKEDIPLLAEMFLRQAAREHGRRLSLTPVGSKILQEYSWPGNTHELKNFIECLAIVHKGPVIDPDILSALLTSYSSLKPLCE